MSGFLDIWLIDLEGDAERLSTRTDLIGTMELRRSEALLRPADRVAYLASHAGLRIILEEYGAPRGELSRDECGKPYLVGAPEFSLSRTSGMAIVAVADQPVGIDIEAIRPVVLTEPAVAWLARVRGVTTLEAWTALEAWSKWNGCGMSQLLSRLGRSETWRSNWLSLSGRQLGTVLIPGCHTKFCAAICSGAEHSLHSVERSLEADVHVKAHLLTLLHRLVDGKTNTSPTINPPGAAPEQ